MKQENQDPNAQRRKHLKDSVLRKTIDHISEAFITTKFDFIVYITYNHD